MYVLIVFAPSSSRLSRVVPPVQQYKRGTGSRLVTRSGVFEIPVAERLEHSSSVSFNNTFIQEYITSSLYTTHKKRVSPGAPDLLAGLG